LNQSILRLVIFEPLKSWIMTSKNTTLKGNAPYLTRLIGFQNDEAFGKAMANAAKSLKETKQG
jgi:hypothetical protein